MSLLQRFVLLGLGLFLASISLPYLIDDHWQVNQSSLVINIILGSVVAFYNFLIIYKQATTVHVVIASENMSQKIQQKKGEDNYV